MLLIITILEVLIFLLFNFYRRYKSQKNAITKKYILCVLTLLMLCLVVFGPILINESYKTNSGYITMWDASDMLSYFGVCVGAFSTVFLGIITLYINSKFEEKNIEFEEKNIEIQNELIELTKQSNRIAQMSNELHYPYVDFEFVSIESLTSEDIDKIVKHYTEGIVYYLQTIFDIEGMIQSGNTEKLYLGDCKVSYRRTGDSTGLPKNNIYMLTMEFENDSQTNVSGKRLYFTLKSITETIITSIEIIKLEYFNISGKKEDNKTKEAFLPCEISINGLICRNEEVSFLIEILSPYEDFCETIEKKTYNITLDFKIYTLSGQSFKQHYRMIFVGEKLDMKEVSPATIE